MKYQPNPPLTPDNLKEHINKITLGQYDLFVKGVESGLGYSDIGKLVGGIYRGTIKNWVLIYKEGKK